MKTRTKVLGLVLAAVLLVGATAFTTMAFLTDTDAVENTFVVGKVGLSLDETDVDVLGVEPTPAPSAAPADRVKANEYKLLPGHSYTKDPTVHVDENSEPAYIFVKVENGIAAIEADTEDAPTIAEQIATNGWTALEGETNVYFQTYDGSEGTDYEVFGDFTIKGDLDEKGLEGYEDAKLNITAYAVQMDGFGSAAEAWDATFGAPANP